MKKISIILFVLISYIFASSFIEVESKYNVNKTVAKIKMAIKLKKGFSVFIIVNHKKNAKSISMIMPETQLIIFGNPKAGTILMKTNPLMAYELPMKILVSKKNGKTIITYRDPDWLASTYNLKKSPVIPKMKKAMKYFISTSIKK